MAGVYTHTYSPSLTPEATRTVLWALAAVAGSAVSARLAAKVWGHGLRGLRWDDWFSATSWLLMVCVALTIHTTTTLGFGRPLTVETDDTDSTEEIAQVLLLGYLATSMTFVASGWSKTSFIFQLLPCCSTRLRPDLVTIRAFLWYLVVVINLLMSLASLLPWMMCKPHAKAWAPWIEGSCHFQPLYFKFATTATILSSLIDLLLMCFAWRVIDFHRNSPARRIGIIIAMMFGCVAAMAALMKANYSPGSGYNDGSQPARYMIWSGTEITATIIAAAIPALDHFTHASTDGLHSSPPGFSVCPLSPSAKCIFNGKQRYDSRNSSISSSGSGSGRNRSMAGVGDDLESCRRNSILRRQPTAFTTRKGSYAQSRNAWPSMVHSPPPRTMPSTSSATSSPTSPSAAVPCSPIDGNSKSTTPPRSRFGSVDAVALASPPGAVSPRTPLHSGNGYNNDPSTGYSGGHRRSRSSQIFRPGLALTTAAVEQFRRPVRPALHIPPPPMETNGVTTGERNACGEDNHEVHDAAGFMKELCVSCPDDGWDPYDTGVRDLAATPVTPTRPRNMY